MKTHCFFTHIAFATDARVRATAKATANLLIEINDTAFTSGAKERHLKVSTLRTPTSRKGARSPLIAAVIPDRGTSRPENVSAKQRKQYAHNAPALRAGSKARGYRL